jgi:hypothetical protein
MSADRVEHGLGGTIGLLDRHEPDQQRGRLQQQIQFVARSDPKRSCVQVAGSEAATASE